MTPFERVHERVLRCVEFGGTELPQIVFSDGEEYHQAKKDFALEAVAMARTTQRTLSSAGPLDELNVAEKARFLYVLFRVSQELQGKDLIKVPRFQIVSMFKNALKLVKYPEADLDRDADMLTTKFLDFVR